MCVGSTLYYYPFISCMITCDCCTCDHSCCVWEFFHNTDCNKGRMCGQLRDSNTANIDTNIHCSSPDIVIVEWVQ